MNSLKEFFLSFFESAKERLKNPMIGSFILAWAAINWRLIAILFFSSKTMEKRIEFIETNYFDINYNLWIPIAFAVFYVLILPYIMALFDWLSRKGIIVRKLIAKNHRIADIQFRQEIAAEEWQLEKIREGSPDISALKNRIEKLEISLQERDETISVLTDTNDSLKDVIAEEERQLKSVQNRSSNRRTSSKSKTQSKQQDELKEEKTKTELDNYPIMKDIVIRDLAKTEREWILIYALYSSDFGKNVITREQLLNKYEESNRKTDNRLKNLSNNIKNMIKSGQLKYINNEEMLLTSSGVEMAKEILNR